MSTLKRIVPVVLFVGLVGNWSDSSCAGQKEQPGSVQDNKKQLVETKSCPGCELSGVDLSGLNLDRVNLTGANLEGANLSQARLHLAILNKVNLKKADLRGVGFGGSDLAEADLRGADLRGASFVGAYLVGTKVDTGIDLSKSAEELVAENVSPASQEQKRSPGATKNDEPAKVATQHPVEVTQETVPPPVPEPGFFDKAVGSVTGLFGEDKGEEKKVMAVQADVPSTPAPQAPVAPQPMPEKKGGAVTVQQQTPVEVKQEKVTPPASEPGFFDKAVGSVTGLFGEDKGEEKNVTAAQANVPVTPEPQAPPVAPPLPEKEDAAETVPQQASAEVNKEKVAPPAPEPGFFDKAVGSVTGLFGGNKDEEVKTVEAQDIKEVSAPQVPVEAKPETAVVEKALPAKEVVVVTEKQQVPTEVKQEKATPPAAEPGFFDKAVGSVSGLFGQGKGDENKAVVAKADKAGIPAEVPVLIKAENSDKGSDTNSAAETTKNLERLLETKRCYACSLVGVDLTGKNLDSVDLEGADLTGSTLEGVDLGNANLKGTKLVKVNLRNADLRGADLYKANLSGADLTGAKLEGALLDDAQLSDIVGYEKTMGM